MTFTALCPVIRKASWEIANWDVFELLTFDLSFVFRSMRQNLVAMLADLFNMLEVHPVKSVKHPGSGELEYSHPNPVDPNYTLRIAC